MRLKSITYEVAQIMPDQLHMLAKVQNHVRHI